ncbi:SpoIIE family protein phosphatase [Streptomyces sp. NPDC052023]|uniref:SpoIIE family protein phosphatase n=1 Tax=Streptomyces sp. NPDC052023 TaxID=3365681 RepID=UPI0037D66F38
MDSARHGSEPPAPPGTRDLLDASTDAAAVVSGTGEVIGWTRAAEQLLGLPARDVVGSSAARLPAGPVDPVRASAVADRCRAGMGWSGHVPLRHRDGRRIDADLRVSACFRIGSQECFLVSAREQRQRWTVGQSVVDGFLTRSPVGMAVVDLDLRYVWMNDTLERFGGVPREQRLGRRLSELLPGLQAETLEGLMRKVLLTGVPVTDYEYVGWSWADPHRQHAYSTSFFPLTDDDDLVTGVCYMVLDVTERWNARQLLSLVNDAGTSIGRTLDVMRTAQELADFAVPRFADFVVVDLLEPVLSTEGHGAWLTDAGPASARPVMRRAGMSSVRRGCPEAVARVGDRVDFLPPPHDVNLLIDGEPILIPVLDPSDALWVAEQPARVESIRDFGLHSLLSVPMRARNTALGLTTFLRSLNPTPFQPDDVLLARELVARAALCVDNARRYTREHTAAITLQRSLLPQALMGGTALEVASYYLPADPSGGVGGDWFDVIPLSGARVGLVVGDVVGHGITAAAAMGRLRTAVQTLADMDLPPADLLAHLDDLVLRLSEEKTDESTTAFLGATCLYAVYDPVSRRCTMARAGHPPPVVVAPGGQVSFPEPPAGPPLGLGGLGFESTEIELAENSLLGLYTDGLVSGADRDMELGMSRLGEVLARHPTDPDAARAAGTGGGEGVGVAGSDGGDSGAGAVGSDGVERRAGGVGSDGVERRAGGVGSEADGAGAAGSDGGDSGAGAVGSEEGASGAGGPEAGDGDRDAGGPEAGGGATAAGSCGDRASAAGVSGESVEGANRAAHTCRDPAPDLAALCASVVQRLVPVPQPDDIALLLTRTHALGDDDVVSWDVPADPAAVAVARARATLQVEDWGLTELAMTTELIVSELVTNAVRYAEPPIHLRLLRDSRLTCEVADASSTAPRLRHARSTDEGGRGLFLVAQLAHRWGARHTHGGKIIWAEQEIP